MSVCELPEKDRNSETLNICMSFHSKAFVQILTHCKSFFINLTYNKGFELEMFT
jgi:hypothetical protein